MVGKKKTPFLYKIIHIYSQKSKINKYLICQASLLCFCLFFTVKIDLSVFHLASNHCACSHVFKKIHFLFTQQDFVVTCITVSK